MHLRLTRDASRDFPSVSDPGAVETARVWHCKYRTLEPLSSFTNLVGLVVATFPDPSFSMLRGLQQLRCLRIIHMPKVVDLDPLADLANLEILCLETLPSWDASSKRTVVRTLEPLLSLGSLRHLELLGIVPQSRSLDVLTRMAGLQSVRLHGYRKSTVAAFFESSSVANAHAPHPWPWF